MTTRNRGFAAMDKEALRATARKGGQAAHASGHAHQWSSAEALEAAHKGHLARARNRQHRLEAANTAQSDTNTHHSNEST
jgi:hypothetical protein